MGQVFKIPVDKQHVSLTFTDDAKPDFIKGVKEQFPGTLREAQGRLARALSFTARMYGKIDQTSPAFRDLMHLYFGLPIEMDARSKVDYSTALHQITGRLNKTYINLCQPTLEVVDIGEVPPDMRAQVCLFNLVRKALGKEELSFHGYVWVRIPELLSRKLEQSRSPEGALTMGSLSGSIHLSFALVLKDNPRMAVLTLIHEASHKYAGTVDNLYFPDAGLFRTYQQLLLPFASIQGKDPSDPSFRAETHGKLPATGGAVKEALDALAKFKLDDALSNADSYAHYVMDACELEAEYEYLASLFPKKKS